MFKQALMTAESQGKANPGIGKGFAPAEVSEETVDYHGNRKGFRMLMKMGILHGGMSRKVGNKKKARTTRNTSNEL